MTYNNIDDSKDEIQATTEDQMLLEAQQRQQRIFEKHGEKKQSTQLTNRGRSEYKSFESDIDSVVPVKPKKIQEMTIEQFLINKEKKELELENRSKSQVGGTGLDEGISPFKIQQQNTHRSGKQKSDSRTTQMRG